MGNKMYCLKKLLGIFLLGALFFFSLGISLNVASIQTQTIFRNRVYGDIPSYIDLCLFICLTFLFISLWLGIVLVYLKYCRNTAKQ